PYDSDEIIDSSAADAYRDRCAGLHARVVEQDSHLASHGPLDVRNYWRVDSLAHGPDARKNDLRMGERSGIDLNLHGLSYSPSAPSGYICRLDGAHAFDCFGSRRDQVSFSSNRSDEVLIRVRRSGKISLRNRDGTIAP